MVRCNCCVPVTCAHCTGYFGIVVTILGVALAVLQGRIINFGLEQQLTITNGTLFFDEFVEPDIPIYLSVWIWDIQNPEDYTYEPSRIGTGSFTFVRPWVKQIGPFVYQEIWYKFAMV